MPEPAGGEVLVRTLCLSTSPAQRGCISVNRNRQLLPDLAVGSVMRGRGIGVVVASRHPDFRAGELYDASLGWQDFSIQRPHDPDSIFSLRRVEDPVRPLATELGVLGNSGMTAWFGLLEVGQFRGASQVVGIAGTEARCQWLVEELGFSAAVNYRTEDVAGRLTALNPRGSRASSCSTTGSAIRRRGAC